MFYPNPQFLRIRSGSKLHCRIQIKELWDSWFRVYNNPCVLQFPVSGILSNPSVLQLPVSGILSNPRLLQLPVSGILFNPSVMQLPVSGLLSNPSVLQLPVTGILFNPCVLQLLGASEITANLYCYYEHLYWEGCVICSNIWNALYLYPDSCPTLV